MVSAVITTTHWEFDLDTHDRAALWNRAQMNPNELDFRSAVSRLRTLRPGWDSYEARAIDRGMSELAERVVIALMRKYTALDAPSVSPTPSGGLEVEWARDDECLSLEFNAGAQISYFIDDGASAREVEQTVELGPFVEALARFVSGR